MVESGFLGLVALEIAFHSNDVSLFSFECCVTRLTRKFGEFVECVQYLSKMLLSEAG